MVDIPENEVSPNELALWYRMNDDLRKLRAAEMALRQRLFGHYFPEPKEGVNDFPLDDGYVLKGTYKLDRKIDEGALNVLTPFLRENGVGVDELVRWKPDLKTKEYRNLTEEERKLFDQVLIVKPSSPSMEIVKPKGRRKS